MSCRPVAQQPQHDHQRKRGLFVPRLNEEEIIRVADSIIERLQHTKDKAYFMIPKGGVGRYSIKGGVLEDKKSDVAFFNRLKEGLPRPIVVYVTSLSGLNDSACQRPSIVKDLAFGINCSPKLARGQTLMLWKTLSFWCKA